MSSKRRLRRNACGNKRRYQSYNEAVAALKRRAAKESISRWKMAYRCEWCGCFHWGNSNSNGPYRADSLNPVQPRS